MPTKHDTYSSTAQRPEIKSTNNASRRVRRIVTRSGQGVRGRFPSRKSAKAVDFESLVEEAALRVFELAPSITQIEMQPETFEFVDGRKRRYTPDFRVHTNSGATYFEVKPDAKLSRGSSAVDRLQAGVKFLRGEGHTLRFLLESDLSMKRLQPEIAKLLRMRPPKRRTRQGLDMSLWDPERGTAPDAETLVRWHAAQKECDELLARVMRRDPDELLPIEQR